MKEGDLVRSFRKKTSLTLVGKIRKRIVTLSRWRRYIFLSEKVRYVSQINFVPRCSIFTPGIIIKEEEKKYVSYRFATDIPR